MAKVRNFHEKLEADLKRLGLEVQQAREKKSEGTPCPERELLKESIHSIAERVTLPPVSAGEDAVPIAPAPERAGAVPDYTGSMPPEVAREVERLVDVVFVKGLDVGIREAKRQPPFVEDAFHDALVDKFLPELKKRGIIK